MKKVNPGFSAPSGPLFGRTVAIDMSDDLDMPSLATDSDPQPTSPAVVQSSAGASKGNRAWKGVRAHATTLPAHTPPPPPADAPDDNNPDTAAADAPASPTTVPATADGLTPSTSSRREWKKLNNHAQTMPKLKAGVDLPTQSPVTPDDVAVTPDGLGLGTDAAGSDSRGFCPSVEKAQLLPGDLDVDVEEDDEPASRCNNSEYSSKLLSVWDH